MAKQWQVRYDMDMVHPMAKHGSSFLTSIVLQVLQGRLLVSLFLCFLPVKAAVAEPGRNVQEEAAILFQPIPLQVSDIKNNPVGLAKIELGTMLFFDPRLSASQIISCNTCHNLRLGGIDLQETSVGHGWHRGARNAPTVFNSVFNVGQFWDGRAQDLADQAVQPVQRAVEMNNTPERLIKTLKSIPAYVELFSRAFPSDSNPLTLGNIAKAIEAFEMTLLTPDAPIDRFIRGDSGALSDREKEGLSLFIDRNCASCHYGVNFGGMGYYIFGMVIDPEEGVRPAEDVGRFKVTGIEHDRYRFRASPLRNVAVTRPYFHAGKVRELIDAVNIMGSIQLGRKLTQEEAQKITVFLGTLTGKQPTFQIPILPPNGPTTPGPKLDASPANVSSE
jgi:cytochrome c peroxidase